MARTLDYRIVSWATAAAIVLAPCYYLIGQSFNTSVSMSEMFLFTFSTAVAGLAGYELFFTIQRLSERRTAYVVNSWIDGVFPFRPGWVWIYGFLYYPLLCLPLAVFDRVGELLAFIAGGLAILSVSAPVFMLWPTTCPPEWRRFEPNSRSTKLLAFIQRFDNGRTCIPSLHCALSAYAALFFPVIIYHFGLPILISLSCLFVKQHSIIDIPASLVFGFAVGTVVQWLSS